jgi:hypothetical protein
MEHKIPLQLLSVLETWFIISVTCIKWNGHVSYFFRLLLGVRQGGVLSPLLFAIFIDDIVTRVKSTRAGCYISLVCCCIFLYADDILLVSPTVSGLQIILNACETVLTELDMRINVKKSMCIRFGKRFDEHCAELVSAHGGPIKWVESCRYLGVFFSSGRSFRCSLDDAKSRFYRAFNAVYSKVGRFASEPVMLSLIRSKCLPILLYSTEACPLLSRQKHSLEFTVTRIFMRIFHTGSKAVVDECLANFGFLSVNSLICVRTARFLQKFTASENSLCLLFLQNASVQLVELLSYFDGDIRTACQLNNFLLDLLDMNIV